jgi:hypothetical protein
LFLDGRAYLPTRYDDMEVTTGRMSAARAAGARRTEARRIASSTNDALRMALRSPLS